LNDRAADIWEPLFVLADLAGGDWPKMAREAAVGLSGSAEENNPIGSLLLDIFVMFMLRKMDRIFTRDLVEGLKQTSEGRPWMEMRPGRKITDMWLAQQLRPFGIHPKTIWVGEMQAKGYVEADFEEVFRRYISKADVEGLLVKREKGEAAEV
jgi:hypothetical protein